ncbi:MAG: hypothetical protein GEU71_05180 [Actinobacteria bacterium]|nr:hypothetical protein [Actinomycetota bacterium]
MSDLERELRELRDRVSEDVRPSPQMEGVVFRRTRIRRAVTALSGIAVIAAISVVSIVTVGAITGENRLVNPVATPSKSPTPEETQAPEVGRDIGLGFPVCDIKRLRGIDLLGDGSDGTAWTATTLRDDGRCDREYEDSYLVAVDVTGDGRADASWAALKWCVFCRPYATVDFDSDGADELIVLLQGGSVTQYGVFAAAETNGSVEFGPVAVGESGDRKSGFRSGDMTNFWVGGDEGFSGAFGCEGYPEDPVLVIGWTNHPIDGPEAEITEVHLTRLALREGFFGVVDALNTEQPTNDPMPDGFPTGTRGCGLDLNPFR